MNRGELVTAVAERSGLSAGDAAKAIDATFRAIAGELGSGRAVKVVGFGTFLVVDRGGGEGHNPRTGERIRVPPSRTAKFRAGLQLKGALNAGA